MRAKVRDTPPIAARGAPLFPVREMGDFMARSKVFLKLLVLTVAAFFFTVFLRFLLVEKSSLHANSSSSLILPYRGAVKSVEDVLSAGWVSELHMYLDNLEVKYVSVCVADSRYTESVVNWLISALVAIDPPLTNVLVISLDKDLDQFLKSHKLDSIFIDPHTILKSSVHLPTNFSHIWATRFVIFRLMNHWRYNVVTYDSDALLAKNPELLFAKMEESDLIGSPGVYPFNLHRKWKSSTLCMGVVLFRASQRMEKFWDHFTAVQDSFGKFDDQVTVNTALYKCGIVWSSPPDKKSGTVGVCQDLDLSVFLLPEGVVCRRCKDKSGFYVSHQKGARRQEDKRRIAEEGGMWFLKRNLNESSELKGTEWLRFLYSS